mgnify:CR=1 FL=1
MWFNTVIEENKIIGIITDGDRQRSIEFNKNIFKQISRFDDK